MGFSHFFRRFTFLLISFAISGSCYANGLQYITERNYLADPTQIDKLKEFVAQKNDPTFFFMRSPSDSNAFILIYKKPKNGKFSKSKFNLLRSGHFENGGKKYDAEQILKVLGFNENNSAIKLIGERDLESKREPQADLHERSPESSRTNAAENHLDSAVLEEIGSAMRNFELEGLAARKLSAAGCANEIPSSHYERSSTSFATTPHIDRSLHDLIRKFKSVKCQGDRRCSETRRKVQLAGAPESFTLHHDYKNYLEYAKKNGLIFINKNPEA